LEEFLTAQALHLAKGFLDDAPIGNGLFEPFILLLLWRPDKLMTFGQLN